MSAMKTAMIAATLAVVGCGASAGIADADPPVPPPPPAPATTMGHDGTYAVGTDIAAGTYSSAGPVGGGACYWKRMSSNGGDIIDSAMSLKPQVVQIDPSDKAFKTDGCQPWQKTDSASTDAQPPGGLPALAAEAQLRADMDTLNANARQFGAGPLPGP